MSQYFLLKQSVAAHNGCVEGLLAALQAANDPAQRNLEATAATKIQSVARMFAQRSVYLIVRRRIIDIQRCFRGYRDKKTFLREKISQQLAYNLAVFNHFATKIQSVFRGYLLRKNHCDYYARKHYMEAILERNESVRNEANAAYEAQRQELERKQKEDQQLSFINATKNLHHLLSTSAISGIYRPTLSVHGVQTVFGTNIEDDLRAIPASSRVLGASGSTTLRKFKPDLPSKSSKLATTTTSAEEDINANNTAQQRSNKGTVTILPPSPAAMASSSVKHVPHAPPPPTSTYASTFQPSNAALQNAVPFQYEKIHDRLQLSVDKKLQSNIHNGTSFLARKVDPIKFGATNNTETPFIEVNLVAARKR